ncbi:GtrA family protein [Agromyces aurantiacus]|uniref:GtrA family protein n=1 Tax=Agromyces aurantiacus TaxID=165814 RepID=A0ABV9R2C8_9MICO|nr:GtrA family protein [Agromyces aurantiacus]MBM7502960.1 putative flippase GtrA [Agromyces aurantiacus]
MSERVAVATPVLTGQVVRFAAVGGIGLTVDVAVFNLLLAAPHAVHGWPMIAKGVALFAAIALNWVGSRFWTFRSDARRTDVGREAAEFLVASLAGSLVALACLGFSHYALGLTSVFADNVSANVVGLLLGSAVRFAAYRWWVFDARRAAPPPR